MTVYAVRDPRSGEVLATYPTATAGEIEAAVASAAATHADWVRSTSVEDRCSLLRRVSDLHLQRRDELAKIARDEMGKPLSEGVEEAEFSAAIYRYYADNAERFLADEPIDLPPGSTGHAVIRRTPVGALLGIMPWNFPTYQVARFAAPNLAAGNTIVLKHAPQCPGTAAALLELFTDAGFPEGAYTNVYATEAQVADIIADPRIQGVSLTGSERAGSAVAELAGRHLKKVVLELGGSDPFLLLSADDVNLVVEAAVAARVYNGGQVCNAAKRFIVLDDLHDEFVARLEERLRREDGFVLASATAAELLAGQLERAVRQGAELRAAGRREGANFPPGFLLGVSAAHDVYREELFGPVATVLRARDEEEAIAIANDTPFGLGAYVYTTDPAQAERVADRLDVGMVFINGVNADGPELPFGGVKRSGFGRELGRYGIEEFVNKKLIRTLG